MRAISYGGECSAAPMAGVIARMALTAWYGGILPSAQSRTYGASGDKRNSASSSHESSFQGSCPIIRTPRRGTALRGGHPHITRPCRGAHVVCANSVPEAKTLDALPRL